MLETLEVLCVVVFSNVENYKIAKISKTCHACTSHSKIFSHQKHFTGDIKIYAKNNWSTVKKWRK